MEFDGNAMVRGVRKFAATCVTLGMLATCAAAHAQRSPLAEQIAQDEQKLASARAGQSPKDVATELMLLGGLYRQIGDMQKSLDRLNEALPMTRSGGNRAAQATVLDTMGRVYTDLGQEDKALALLNQALQLWQAAGLRQGQADALNYLGKAYNNLGQRSEALKRLNDALSIWREVDQQSAGGAPQQGTGGSGEASTLHNLAETYSDMGQGKQALDYFNQALPIWRAAGERGGEALTLDGMGRAYADLGEKQISLTTYNQALAIWREIGNRQGEARTLNNIGRLYRDLGEEQSALDYYNQVLPLWRATGNRNGEALALNDIARAYADTGKASQALEDSAQSLQIWRETGNRRGEATTLNNMGNDYSQLGEADHALDFDNQALAIWREVQDSRGEALALMSVSRANAQHKEMQKALVSDLAALSLAKTAGDPLLEGGIETSLMIGFRNQSHHEEAIYFGVDAVNSYQQIRKNIFGMEKDLQAGFAQSKARTYRVLAELLVQTGRLGEAEQILDLLKEQELKDIVPGATSDGAPAATPLVLGARQQKAEGDLVALENKALAFEESSVAYAVLQAKDTRTAAEDAQLSTLRATVGLQNAEVQSLLASTEYVGPKPDAEQGSGRPGGEARSYLQDTLAKLGPHVLGIRLLLGEDHAYAIVVSAHARKMVELRITPEDLRNQAFAALKAMNLRAVDPRPQLTQLYTALVAPFESDLKVIEAGVGPQDRAPTLLWSLDDALRYLPMSALYDGQHYLVERFNNVLFTPESYGHMTDSPLLNGPKPSVLAMGLSRSYGGLPALPGVMPELKAVVHDSGVPDSHGPMEGKLLPNDQFTLAALKSELGAGNGFSVIHIASHFVVETGTGVEPYLMMGGEDKGQEKGYEWNLSDMENSAIAFKGTRLLTLSACSTAKDYTSRNGLEMDSLGMIAQQKDAEAVLATMWDVNDASTSRIMSDFYSRWVKSPALGKAEALRQAQLAFLHGASSGSAGSDDRGIQAVEDSTSTTGSLGYSHPYYWAPFVLIGNYQ